VRKVLIWWELREVVAAWVRAALDAQVGNQTELAERSGVGRETIWRLLKQKTDADPKTLRQLAAVVGAFPTLQASQRALVVARIGQEVTAVTERAGAGHKGEAVPTAHGMQATPSEILKLLEGLPEPVQREALVRAFERGVNRQELYGSGILRAAISMCAELRRIGFGPIAEEIEAEFARAAFEEFRKRHPEEQSG